MNEMIHTIKNQKDQDIQILTWKIDNQIFGIDVQHVKEIEDNTLITTLPLAPKTISGISNIRGEIVTVLDLKAKLGYHTSNINKTPKNDFFSSIILLKNKKDEENNIAFKIDELLDILDVNEEKLEPPPGNLDIIEMQYISSVVSTTTNLIIILNYEGLVHVKNNVQFT